MKTVLTIIKYIFEIGGSLALFLFGMKMLGDGLQKAAGNGLKKTLGMMTGNRFKAVLTGVLVTAIIQSSSATTVMVVSFVNAGLLTVVQSIGVILGANIGTTITGWLVALIGFKFSLSSIAIPCVGIGFPLLFNKRVKLRHYGDMLIGFGLLFLGLSLLKHAMPSLSVNDSTISIFKYLNNPSTLIIVLCVLAGTLFTIIVQSSSATMAIILTMAFSGYLGPISAAAMVLGQNIGTTITAYLASIGTNTNARRAAWAHILFNVIGTIISLILFMPLMKLVNLITISDIFTISNEELKRDLPTYLAMFHTVFNVLNTLIFLPFLNQFSNLVCKLVKPRKSESDKNYHFEHITSSYNDSTELSLISVEKEINKMAELSKKMLCEYIDAFDNPKLESQDVSIEMKQQEDYADQMQEQLTEFIIQIMQDNNYGISNANELTNLLRIIDEFESITDSCYNLICMSSKKESSNITFADKEKEVLKTYHSRVLSYLEFILTLLKKDCRDDDLLEARKKEEEIDKMRYAFRSRIDNNIIEGNKNIKGELLLLDIVRHLEHIGDYCLNIAETLHLGHKKIREDIE